MAIKPNIRGLREGWTSSGEELGDASELSDARYTIKVSLSGSSAAAANSFLSISSTRLIVGTASSAVYVFYWSSRPKKLTSIPLKVRKNISRTKSGLTLATRKVSSKNFTRLALSVIKKAVTTIPKVSNMVPSIFCALTSVGLTGSPSFRARAGWMALTLLPKSRSANIDMDFFRKVMEYRMHGTCTRFRYSSLLSTPSLPTLVDSTASTVSIDSATASSLVSVTGVEVAETDTSFLASGDTWWRNTPFGDSYSTRLGRYLSPPS